MGRRMMSLLEFDADDIIFILKLYFEASWWSALARVYIWD